MKKNIEYNMEHNKMEHNKIIEFSRGGGRQFIMNLNKAWKKIKEKDRYDKVWEMIKKKNNW